MNKELNMNLPWVKIAKAVVALIVLVAAFWWFSLVPRAQAIQAEAYPVQVRAACHEQALKSVEEQTKDLDEEARAQFNDITAYEVQYTLCRRANGVND